MRNARFLVLAMVGLTLSSCGGLRKRAFPADAAVVDTKTGKFVTVRVLKATHRGVGGGETPWFRVTVQNTHSKKVEITIDTVARLFSDGSVPGRLITKSHTVQIEPSKTETAYERKSVKTVTASLVNERELDGEPSP